MLAVTLFILIVLLTCDTSNADKPLVALKWMHIPKTSSWMGDFLLLYACPHLRPMYNGVSATKFLYDFVRENNSLLMDCKTDVINGRGGLYGWHDPYNPMLSYGMTVTLFRKPENRLISAYLFGNGMMIPPGSPWSSNMTHQQIIFRNISQGVYPIMRYSELPGISSCQIKMVLGRHCGAVVSYQDLDLERAKNIVEFDFPFVGLTEESHATASLFYAMFGYDNVVPFTDPFERQYRKNYRNGKALHNKLMEVLKDQNWVDDLELQLYEHVKKIFYKRCAQHNIETLEKYNLSVR